MSRKLLVSRLCALALVSLCGSLSAGIDVPFSFDAKQMSEKPTTVHVAGQFNNWNNQAFALTDPDGDFVFTGTLNLDEGEYQYKLVLDANTRMLDLARSLGFTIGDAPEEPGIKYARLALS